VIGVVVNFHLDGLHGALSRLAGISYRYKGRVTSGEQAGWKETRRNVRNRT
jgi:hypothetical protein